MGITLYEHNLIAYKAALNQMEHTKKAAVIHPTGTGKSFLAFQLCQEHQEQTVCWLSPSEYIFRTQEENWSRAGGGKLSNIRFFTYAKLMLMNKKELEELQPDYIVLDEFHRCGARMWGQGVSRLLSLFPETPLLGLSATNIRYLDNQRDMADELFDGCIASEMTLGEAVVRGILHPPKYVLSVFSYQKDIKRYEERIRFAKSRAVREAAGKALEALRRALEKADGMEEVFYKHMPDAAGKYLVFCANYKHMQEMMEKVPEWFGKVDQKPHVYSVYAEDPGTSKEFAAFKKDESSHLKLLFCIDMLNEGIHVEDISGVILLRPTVSPIIYKQQIGRALSAGKKQEAVVFDIVLNIENLYSIGALEEEMQAAVEKFRTQGKEGDIVNHHFRVVDEVGDCIRLFQQLEGTLAASWDAMYETAKQYYIENGNLEVTKRYVTPTGLPLGQWLDTQRRVYTGKVSGILTEAQIDRLNALDMRWQEARDAVWERNFEEARKYYKAHGNLLIGAREEVNGIPLGRWIAQLRVSKKKQDFQSCLTPERVQALEEIGMIWDVPAYQWEQNYEAAKAYYQKRGDLNVPSTYVDENGVCLGAWIGKMRVTGSRGNSKPGQSYRGAPLTQEQIARLNEIGMVWQPKRDHTWANAYALARAYQQEHGDLNIPVSFATKDGCRLGKWIRHQRDAWRDGTLSGERKKKLESIGMFLNQ